MDNKTFLQIFGEIDDKYIQQANEDINYWEESQIGISVHPSNTRRSSLRAAILSAACTAAAMLGVFVLLLNMGIVGKIEIIEGPASPGAEITNSSESQSGIFSDIPVDTFLYEDAAYAYDESDVFKRYEVGDMFGEHRLLSAKNTYYKLSDSVQIRKKQEITVGGRFLFDMSNFHYSDGSVYLEISVGNLQKLGLPSFSKDFDEDMPCYYPPNSRSSSSDDTMNIGFTELNITVDYVDKTVTVIAQNILDIYD